MVVKRTPSTLIKPSRTPKTSKIQSKKSFKVITSITFVALALLLAFFVFMIIRMMRKHSGNRETFENKNPSVEKLPESTKGNVGTLGYGPRLEGTGKTTRYGDCCKPGCGWPDKNTGGGFPVRSCDRNNVRLDPNVQSVHEGGIAGTCTNQYPFTIDGRTFATVASKFDCGKCFRLYFNNVAKNGGTANKTLFVQVTNGGAEGEYSYGQFDLNVPGGGEGYNMGCSHGMYSGYNNISNDANGYTNGTKENQRGPNVGKHPTWGWRWGGLEAMYECDKLPPPLRAGCRFRWTFGGPNGDLGNENEVYYKEIRCPNALVARTGLRRKDEVKYQWYE
jgi:hypothetical protein